MNKRFIRNIWSSYNFDGYGVKTKHTAKTGLEIAAEKTAKYFDKMLLEDLVSSGVFFANPAKRLKNEKPQGLMPWGFCMID